MTGFLAAFLYAVLFNTPTESKWTVTKGGAAVGNVTLLTGRNAVRAEFRAGAKAPVVVFLGGSDGKVWARETGGDVELASFKGGAEKSFLPALLFTDAKAKYTKDAKGAAQVDVNGYVLKRTSLAASNADASNFSIRPKTSAASRLARVTNILGPSNSTVSATAGGRGVGTKGLKLADGGDYAAVESIENRDAAWAEKMSDALAEFQKDGKVGQGREQ
jgi:hypothetical protein